jgi:hypothetical protein
VRVPALELDPALVVTLQRLAEQRVDFVLVGDMAEAIHADGGFVPGVAIVPGAYGRNVERLRAALLALGAEPAGTEQLQPPAACTVRTPYADVDVSFQPPGTGGYRDLIDDAARVPLAAGVEPLVASPDDLERIRRGAVTAGRA